LRVSVVGGEKAETLPSCLLRAHAPVSACISRVLKSRTIDGRRMANSESKQQSKMPERPDLSLESLWGLCRNPRNRARRRRPKTGGWSNQNYSSYIIWTPEARGRNVGWQRSAESSVVLRC